ncbi:MAG: hypothetical protein J5621_08130 [Paludibacteraceae bacterium]|nr:hypothetical protein [Paludibacteraceae bacterium]
MQQAIYRETYCDKLRNELYAGVSIDRYIKQTPTFNAQEDDLCYLDNFEVKREKLSEMLKPGRSNLDCAISLYEAFPDLTPMLAAYEPFWFYWAHTELFEYLRNRWTNIEVSRDGVENSEEQQIEYIQEYWFPDSSKPVRSWLSGLWWSVYLTVDENDEKDKYRLTRILFKQEDLRTRTFGTYLLFRHKPAAIATLRFIEEHMDTTFSSAFQNKCRYMTKYLNYLGGSRQLSYMDEAFFTEMLNKKNADIAKVV